MAVDRGWPHDAGCTIGVAEQARSRTEEDPLAGLVAVALVLGCLVAMLILGILLVFAWIVYG